MHSNMPFLGGYSIDIGGWVILSLGPVVTSFTFMACFQVLLLSYNNIVCFHTYLLDGQAWIKQEWLDFTDGKLRYGSLID